MDIFSAYFKGSIHFGLYPSLIIACLVLLIGHYFLKKSKLLAHYSIPEPVVGGLLIAAIVLIFRQFGVFISFDNTLQAPLMLLFFGTIGLSADLATLKTGGKALCIFLVAILGLLILQNTLGIALAKLLGLDGLMGIILGSITLSGGHSTAGAWGPTLMAAPHNISTATDLGIAGATFGLILGCLIGGPVGRYLLTKIKNPPKEILESDELTEEERNTDDYKFVTIETESRITPLNFIQTLLLLFTCVFLGQLITPFLVFEFESGTFQLPVFVSVLFIAALFNNFLSFTNLYNVHGRSTFIIGNVSLILFLAFALMTLKLWELANLALPMVIILIAQAVLMAFFAIFVTFRLLGSNYDAAVIAVGHCGFGLGATPTAIVNMQAITKRFGPSQLAFLIVPMVGAFFVDLLNAVIIPLFMMFAKMF